MRSDTASTSSTLTALIEKARRRELPNRAELVTVALQLALDAREHVREYVSKEGEVRSYPDPNFQAANKAVEVAAALALKEGPKPEARPEELTEQLAKLGYRLVKDDGARERPAGDASH